MNPGEHHPAYYPKAELRAAIGELIETLKLVRDNVPMKEYPGICAMTNAMIAKHQSKKLI